MVPVIAVGFNDLKKRMEMQEYQRKLHKEKLEVIMCDIRKCPKQLITLFANIIAQH